MLFILVNWILLAISTTTLGWLWWRGWAYVGVDGPRPEVEILSLSGIAVSTLLLAPLSLVFPLAGTLQPLAGIGLLIVLFWQWQPVRNATRRLLAYPTHQGKWIALGVLSLLLLALLFQASTMPINPDALLYYTQTLQWIAQWPAVPGLGNLHGRLAFNSSLFLPTAFFGLSTPTGIYYGLPTYCYVLLAIAATRALGRALTTTIPVYGWVWAPLLFYFILTYYFKSWLSSPAPDCALAVFLVLIFLRYIHKWQADCGPYFDQDTLLLTLLTSVAVTIKLSALPVLALIGSLLWAGRTELRFRQVGWVVSIVALVLIPWLLRNSILSGYLFYPLPALDLLTVDWKVPITQVRTEQRLIINMARATEPAYWTKPPATTLGAWLPAWWRQQNGNPIEMITLLLVAISPIGLIWLRKGLRAGWLVTMAGAIFWFAAAPDYRFGIGFLLLAGLCPWLAKIRLPTLGSLGLTSLALLGALHVLRDPVYVLRHLSSTPNRYAQVVWPIIQPTPATTPTLLHNRPVRIAQHEGACGNTLIPCTYYLTPGLEYRGPTLADGFRVRPQPTTISTSSLPQ